MRILHVVDTLGVGGAEQMLVNLLPELARRGHDVAVAVLRPPLTLKPALEERGVPVELLARHGKWNLLAGARNVARAGVARRAEVINAHLLFPSIYTGLARLLGLTKARTCVTYHNVAYARGVNKPGPGLWLRRALNAIASRFGMDGRMAVSRAVAEHYGAALRSGPVDVIPNPIPLEYIDSVTSGQPQPDRRDGPLHLVLPGRLVHEKGHAVAIDAVANLLANGHDVRLTCAGDGPLRSALEKQVAAAGLGPRVTFTGLLPHQELLRTVAAADIVLVPSLFEGFGMTAAEAMALGRPLVAARTGGLLDIVENGVSGLLVEPGNAVELAAAVARLAADPGLCARLGEAGRRRVAERFAAPAVAAQVEDIYRRLCGRAA